MGRYDSPYAGDTLAYSHAGNSLAKTTSFGDRSRGRSRSRSRSQSRGRSRSRGRSQSQGIEVSLRQSGSATRGRSRRRSRSQRSLGEKSNSKQTTRSTLVIRSGSAKQRDRRRSRSRIRSGVCVTDDQQKSHPASQRKSGFDSNSDDDSDDRSHDLSMITPHPFLPPKGPVTCLSLVDDIKNITSWNARFVWIQLLSGLSVALVQVPECVSYAYIAGIDPFHALQSAWVANVLVPLVGGRPGMLSGTSGLGAIAIRYLVVNYGMEYIFYAVMLSGLCQVLFGALRIGRYLRLLPPGITIGMVNALCTLLVLLQFRYFKEFPGGALTAEATSAMGEPTRRLDATTDKADATEADQPWAYYFGYGIPWSSSTSQTLIVSLEALAAIAICFLLPRFSRLVPSPLVALLVLTGVNSAIGAIWPEWDAATIGDYTATESTSSMAWMGIFHSSYDLPNLVDWKTIAAIAPTGLSLFCISLLETMVALNVTDKYTNTDSEQDRVFYGQGVANLAGGIMAGMGSAGQPQSLHNLRNGGVSSTSAFMAGVYMLLISMFAYPAVAHVPLGATMGVTLYLIWCMMQWRPLIALVLKAIPDQCLLSRPKLLETRLAAPDLVSTMASSMLVLFSSTFALAGFFVGAMCYACDPIGHATISTDNPKGYTFIDLCLSKPQAIQRNPLRRKRGGDSTASQSSQSVEDEFSSEYSPA